MTLCNHVIEAVKYTPLVIVHNAPHACSWTGASSGHSCIERKIIGMPPAEAITFLFSLLLDPSL